MTPALEIAAGLLGGGLAAGSHATKAGTRVMINTARALYQLGSIDYGGRRVVAGLWTALNHPVILSALLVLFVLLIIWLLPKLWRGIKAVFRKNHRLFRGNTSAQEIPSTPPGQGDEKRAIT